MVSVFPNGICAVIMYASILCRHYQPCHLELHKCNYTKPLITKQCNLLLERKNILELYNSKRKHTSAIGDILQRKLHSL